MKNLLLATLLIGVAAVSHAEPLRLVSSDGSVYSQLCMEVVQSPLNFRALAEKVGVADLPKEELKCNGIGVDRFVSKLRKQQLQPVPRIFRITDNTELSRLCLAAVKSDEEYQSIKTDILARNQAVESEILCNGQPIREFARKYRNAGNMTASIR